MKIESVREWAISLVNPDDEKEVRDHVSELNEARQVIFYVSNFVGWGIADAEWLSHSKKGNVGILPVREGTSESYAAWNSAFPMFRKAMADSFRQKFGTEITEIVGDKFLP